MNILLTSDWASRASGAYGVSWYSGASGASWVSMAAWGSRAHGVFDVSKLKVKTK